MPLSFNHFTVRDINAFILRSHFPASNHCVLHLRSDLVRLEVILFISPNGHMYENTVVLYEATF